MKSNSYIFMFRQMRRNAPDKKLLGGMLIFSIISKLISLVEPYILGQLINIVQAEGAAGRSKIVLLLIVMALAVGLFRSFHGISRVRENKGAFQISEHFMHTLFRKIASLPMQRHSDNHSGKTIDKINKAFYALRSFSGNNFMYLNTIIFSIGSVISLSFIRRPAGVVLLGVAIITAFSVRKFDRICIPLQKQKNKKEHLVMSTLFDFLSNIKTVITLRFESRALATLRQKVADVFPPFIKYIVINEWKWFSMDMLMTISVSLIMGLYIAHQFALQGTILIGTLTMLRQYIEKMTTAFNNFTWQYSQLVQYHTDMLSVEEIEDAYAALPSQQTNLSFDKTHPVQIKDLHFSYMNEDQQKQVLRGVDLELHPSQRIALVGSSGSGKSTVMMLLRGLYEVDQVQLCIGDQCFESLRPLSNYTSLIPQEPEIFEQTIRYNITMGIDVDDSTVQKYLEMACFDDVVEQLPHGLDTDIKEKGVNLSGGQKQRLALARGLLMSAESSILLLDESTSSVDIHNEKRIYENIFSTHPDTCIVASIHKLHLLPMFDMVYLIDEGKVVESGTFDKLIAKKTSQLAKLRKDYQVDTTQE